MRQVRLGVLISPVIVAMGMAGIGVAQTLKAEFPGCKPLRLISPDGRWILISPTLAPNCPAPKAGSGAAQAAQNSFGVELYIENAATHQRRSIAFDGYDGEAAWSPSSKAFFVNDHSGSNITESSLFFASSPRAIDVAKAIRRADPGARRYFDVHSYFYARKWLDDRTALVQFCGHTDVNLNPGVQFDFRYRVGLDGSAKRLSRKITPPTVDGDCTWSEKQ